MILRIDDIEDYLDKEDVIELAELHDLQVIDIEVDTFGVDLKKISMNDADKIELFFEKFQYVPLDKLEEFLNNYKL